MDYSNSLEQSTTPKKKKVLQDISSPEMFDSDAENEYTNSDIKGSQTDLPHKQSPKKPSQEELILRTDNYILGRINKFLSGVPPPPRLTICQRDCSEFLQLIEKNHHLFYTPNTIEYEGTPKSDKSKTSVEQNVEKFTLNTTPQRPKCGLRNLTNAFNACDLSHNIADSEIVQNDEKVISKIKIHNNLLIEAKNLDITESNNKLSTVKTTVHKNKNTNGSKEILVSSSNSRDHSLICYNTVGEKDITSLQWPEAFYHRFHGIHYNRNKAVEEFENLTTKLCERYIGAETQSTCNIWFTKQAPGSAKKRNMLNKRQIGQSPGKRLSHLARRRRTFSSANLQGLEITDKKHLVLINRKTLLKKGKSPRGKSPRSSTKKKAVRRLALDNSSPRNPKLETSKRALFQSPPSERPGTSKMSINSNNINASTIKRALFPTPKKNDAEKPEIINKNEESRKRKCEEELEGHRYKWAKRSLSFDCTHEFQSKSMTNWSERHSSTHIISKNESTFSQHLPTRNELSDAHRKKLLWAVAEALRSKGIGMSHPLFKQYASNLARTVKKFMPDLENKNLPRKPGSTTDRMLKLAKHHVLLVIESKTATTN